MSFIKASLWNADIYTGLFFLPGFHTESYGSQGGVNMQVLAFTHGRQYSCHVDDAQLLMEAEEEKNRHYF